MKHKWKLDEDTGNVDNFAMSWEFHNGPVCERCGFSFCMLCRDEWDTECPGYRSSDEEEYW